MENNIYHLSTGVKNITVVGLPEGAKNLVLSHQNSICFHEHHYSGNDVVAIYERRINLPPGRYTLIGTLNEMSEEQAARLVPECMDDETNPLYDVFHAYVNGAAMAVEYLRSLLESHGLLNKYPNVAILEKIK